MTFLSFRNYPVSLIFLFSVLAVVTSCDKNSSDLDSADYKVQSEVRDSAYLFTKDIYLWTEKLPSIAQFKPRTSANIYALMEKVRTYQPLDKWSFVETKAETKQSEQGGSTDFGFMVKFMPGSDVDMRVTYVYANSSAGTQGVKRTWRLNKINGRIINRSVSADLDYINDILFGEPVTAAFEFIKRDGSSQVLNLQKTSYVLNTVLFKNVYTQGPKKIGYLVFNQFSGPTSITELQNAMSYFQVQGVNEMVVDLRYNRGGFVSTQDYLANSLAPLSVGQNQKVMYTYKFNDRYKKWDETSKFAKEGTLNLGRVVFIVSPSSASASELLINNLRPVMDVKLIGETRTYGKPVGFFPIPVFQYNIFPVSFKTVNSAGEADYFGGFPVQKNVADDLLRDFGDPNEANLKEALYYLTNNTFSTASTARISSVSQAEVQKVSELNYQLSEHLPAVAVENRPSRMPDPIRALQR